MIFDTIYYEWTEITLQHPIDVDIRTHNRSYVMGYKPLGLWIKGSSYLDCEIGFQDELDLMYENIGLEPDDDLENSAKHHKERILWHVGIA